MLITGKNRKNNKKTFSTWSNSCPVRLYSFIFYFEFAERMKCAYCHTEQMCNHIWPSDFSSLIHLNNRNHIVTKGFLVSTGN